MNLERGSEVPAPRHQGTLLLIVIVGLALLNLLQWMSQHPAQQPPQPTASPALADRAAPTDADVKTMTVAWQPLQRDLSLTGQVALTERGRSDVTAPLGGRVATLAVRVGQAVAAGEQIAVLNGAFGQTAQQMLQKLEQDQATLLAAQNQLQAAQSTIGQAQAAVAQAQTALSQAQDNLSQARAEMVNATADYRRKKELFEGGVYSRADVGDAHERWLKARAVLKDTENVVAIARRAVAINEQNLRPARENASLCRHTVELAQAALERDRAIYSQAEVSGASLPQDLTAVNVGGGGGASAASSAMFPVAAPIAGIVTALNVTSGQVVAAGAPIATISETHEVYVDANAYDADLPMIAVGDRVKVRAPAAPHEVFGGQVVYVGRGVDPNTRTVSVRSRIVNDHDVLRPSMLSPSR